MESENEVRIHRLLRNNSLKNYERRPSRHRMEPSNPIRHGSVKTVKLEDERNLQRKKKFLTLVSQPLHEIKQKGNGWMD